MRSLIRTQFLAVAAAVWLASPVLAQQLEIVEASYGSGNFQMNVAQKLRGLVRNNALDVSVDPGVLGGDPAPGSAKRLRIVYRYNGRQYEAAGGDFERIRIPGGASPVTPVPTASTPAQQPASGGGFSIGDLWGGGSSLRIVAAQYGDATRFNDVRDRLQALVRNDALSLKIDNAAMGGDPAVARDKTVRVTYEYRGTTFETSVREGATLTLPDSNARAVSTANTTTVPAIASTAATPTSLQIISARYGGDNRYNDVRDRLQGMVRNGASLAIKVDNATMGGDPAVAKDKLLEVTYAYNGSTYSIAAKEGQSMNLPDSRAAVIPNPVPAQPTTAASSSNEPVRAADSDGARRRARVGGPLATTPSGGREIIPIGRTGGLRIFYARYGAPGQEVDARERLRPILAPESLSVVVGSEAMGEDPAPGVLKTLTVLYEFRGRTFEKVATDGQTLVLP